MNVPGGAGMISQEEVNKQLTAVCKIEIQNEGRATGFFGLSSENQKSYLITNDHVFNGDPRSLSRNISITFQHCDTLLTGDQLFNEWMSKDGVFRQNQTEYGLDYTIIEVKKEKLDELEILPFDLSPTELKENDQLIVAGHPVIDGVQQRLQLSFHRCKKKLGFLVFYGCATYKGSSGSPVMKVVKGALRVVALHCGCKTEYLNYGSLFSEVLFHAAEIESTVSNATVLDVNQFLEKVKWNPLEPASMLRLLQPVESSWISLADYLLTNNSQYIIATIQADCFRNNSASENALRDVLAKWRQCTVRANRIWQTLCVAANNNNDNSLEQYITANGLQSNEEPMMNHLQSWSQNSPLRAGWYNFAVELVGIIKADNIKADHFGGGCHSALQRMLVAWYNSTTDHSWQVIIDALTNMDELSVIEAIEKECLTW